MKFEIIAFTAKGAALAEKIAERYPGSHAFAPARFRGRGVQALEGSLADWTRARFQKGNALVFIGAAGIAVRAVAPFLKGKSEDAAVLCADERGEYVIPLLSGHLGGANRAAAALADALSARAVVTTATDTSGVFAVDS